MRRSPTIARLLSGVAALALGLLLAGTAWALDYGATLSGLQETPPNASTARGVGCFFLDAGNYLHYDIHFGGLGSPETGAHIHRAPAGTPGGIIFPLPLGNPKIGMVGPLSAADVADLNAGNLYVNIHTTNFGGGEIRGQIYPAEKDSFPDSEAKITIQGPFGSEDVTLTGPSKVSVAINNLADSDGDGLEQVKTEMVMLELTGTSVNLGPITVRLRDPGSHPFMTSPGEIEETANTMPGRLDLPPFAPSGTANSFFDVFVEVRAAGQVFHTHQPKPMSTVIRHKPPAPGDTYQNPQVIQLFDANENPTPYAIGPSYHTPDTGIEHDTFPNSLAILTLIDPAGGTENITLNGPSAVDVNLGGLSDSDVDGLEQVRTELIQLSLTGTSPTYGPIQVRLRPVTASPFQRSLGEIEEDANTQPGRLDLPPFAPGGTAKSFFDVFFEVQVGANVLHNGVPKHLMTTIRHKPPVPGDNYESPQIVDLLDENGNPTGFRVGPSRHAPDPIEPDPFSASHAVVDVQTPGGVRTIVLDGPSRVDVNMGGISDSDTDGLEQVETEMVSMWLKGTDPVLGPVSMSLRAPNRDPFQRTLGQIEENANTMPGRLDLPPFAPSGTASSFFDVFFEFRIPSQQMILHNRIPKRMQTVITSKPPGPGETYENPQVIQLYDEYGNPTQFQILRVTHTPQPTGQPPPVDVGPQGTPQRVAIQAIRPNPTAGSTDITYGLPRRARVSLVVYDVTGRTVRQLVNRTVEAGVHRVTWDGRDAAGKAVKGGVYFARLESGGLFSVGRIVVTQ